MRPSAFPFSPSKVGHDIFLRGALQDHNAVRAKGKTENARRGKRLIGPWVHSTGRRNNTPAGQAADPNAVDFGAAAEVDLQRVYLRWFDYWLKGMNNGVLDEAPVRIFVMGENYWRDEQEGRSRGRSTPTTTSPAAGVRTRCSATGRCRLRVRQLAPNPIATSTIRRIRFRRSAAICAARSRCRVGPDQRAAERRDDVLVFTSEVLTAPVEVTGPIDEAVRLDDRA